MGSQKRCRTLGLNINDTIFKKDVIFEKYDAGSHV